MIPNWKKTVDINFEWKFGQLVVRVLRDDEKYEARDLIRTAIGDDPIVSALGFDKAAMDSLIKFINIHDQNIALGCFTKAKRINIKSARKRSKLDEIPSTSKTELAEWTEPKLVAVDTLYVRNIRDQYPELDEESKDPFMKWMKYTKKIENCIWIMGNEKISNILTTFGVFVSKAYKDEGIVKEMIKLRPKLAHKLKIDVTGAAIIGVNEQKYAEKINYEIMHDLNNEELTLHNASSANLETIFPIVVMAFKKVYRQKRTIADVRKSHKKRKSGNNSDGSDAPTTSS